MGIKAVHNLIYAYDAEAARAFFRDVLGFEYVDDGGGWLIFATGPSELGVHPSVESDTRGPVHHEVTFMVDDLAATMTELSAKGAVFTRAPLIESFGITVEVEVPGASPIMLYEPRHTTAYDKDR